MRIFTVHRTTCREIATVDEFFGRDWHLMFDKPILKYDSSVIVTAESITVRRPDGIVFTTDAPALGKVPKATDSNWISGATLDGELLICYRSLFEGGTEGIHIEIYKKDSKYDHHLPWKDGVIVYDGNLKPSSTSMLLRSYDPVQDDENDGEDPT